VYIREAFGPLPAFLCGWMTLLLIASGAIAAVAMAFAGYLSVFVSLDAFGGRIGVAAATIVLLTATNYLGVKPGMIAANVFTIAKIGALSALIVFGLLRSPAAPPISGSSVPAPPLLNGLATAFVAVLFTIGGWQQTNMVAGEIRNPARNLPRALMIGIAIVIAVYLGATGTYLRALGRDGLSGSDAPAADAMRMFVGPQGVQFIVAAAMLSILGFVNVALLTNARMLYALGRDGAFLPAAGRAHRRFGSPHIALLMLGSWSLVLLFATRGAIGTLLSGVVFADWIFFGLGAASVFVLRRSRSDLDRPYRVLGYPWLPGFFVLCAAVGVVSAYVSALRMSLVGTGMLIGGVALYTWRSTTIATKSSAR